jgi:hypothetical protein
MIYLTEHTRCGDPVDCNLIISSVKDPVRTLQPEVRLIPDDQISITLPGYPDELFDIKIFDTTGKLKLRQKSALDVTIGIKNFPAGAYIISLQNNLNIFTAKFIIP